MSGDEIKAWLLSQAPDREKIKAKLDMANRVIDLAILLEPVYWTTITGRVSHDAFMSEEEFNGRFEVYNAKVTQLIKTLDPQQWQAIHIKLRIDAALIDQNDELYLFLRLLGWEKRQKLHGDISAALWLRQMAEIIRLAFEKVHGVEWLEEDRAFGTWFPGGRESVFGFERPLDNPTGARPYFASNYGMYTGSAVRWYVEGYTEYFAILHVLPFPEIYGIELVNLKGNIAQNKDNIAMKVAEGLEEDKRQRRFSMISFDLDVRENEKFFRNQVEADRIVGLITANQPDFEFANFALDELVEIAARLDEQNGVTGDPLRKADWNGINKGGDFEKKYMEVSERKIGLKGKEWGIALAEYAGENILRFDNGLQRPFVTEVRAALTGRDANYDGQKNSCRFDPATFKSIPRQTPENLTDMVAMSGI